MICVRTSCNCSKTASPRPSTRSSTWRSAPGSPRSRVFVVFLDTYHTTIEDETSARLPLVRLLDRLLDRDDLVALTTPELAAADLDVPPQGVKCCRT